MKYCTYCHDAPCVNGKEICHLCEGVDSEAEIHNMSVMEYFGLQTWDKFEYDIRCVTLMVPVVGTEKVRQVIEDLKKNL